MPCSVVKLPDGTTAIVKHAPTSPRKCSVCGVRTRECKLCDFKVGPGKACDKVLCRSCARHIEPDTDYCPRHAGAAEGRLKL